MFYSSAAYIQLFLFPQLQKHRQDTLSTLPISPDEMELFDIIKCSSDTEVLSKKVLVRIPLSWRSTEFSKLAGYLDKIYINKMITMQGPLHVQTFTLEQIRKPSPTQLASTNFHNVPLKLPINCYCSKYLSTLSEQEKQLLSIRLNINLSKLLSITKNLVSRPTISHSMSSGYSSTTVHIHNPHSHAMVHSV